MDDLTFRIRSQYVERIIWIVIILILLIALVVVSVYKTESCAPGEESAEETDEAPAEEAEPEAETPEPETPAPEKPFTPPEPPVPAGLSGKISYTIDRLDCQALSPSGNSSRAKINSIGITLENGKSTTLVASMAIYIWDSREPDDENVARTGEKPVLIGSIAPGKKFNDFVNVRGKPTSFNDLDLQHFLKTEIVDDADKVVATKTVKLKVTNGQCSMA